MGFDDVKVKATVRKWVWAKAKSIITTTHTHRSRFFQETFLCVYETNTNGIDGEET